MSHVTRTPRSKGQGRQAAILTAMLAHREAAAVGVGTCWPWETAAVLLSARPREALQRLRRSRGVGHSVSPRVQLVSERFNFCMCFYLLLLLMSIKVYSKSAWILSTKD